MPQCPSLALQACCKRFFPTSFVFSTAIDLALSNSMTGFPAHDDSTSKWSLWEEKLLEDFHLHAGSLLWQFVRIDR